MASNNRSRRAGQTSGKKSTIRPLGTIAHTLEAAIEKALQSSPVKVFSEKEIEDYIKQQEK